MSKVERRIRDYGPRFREPIPAAISGNRRWQLKRESRNLKTLHLPASAGERPVASNLEIDTANRVLPSIELGRSSLNILTRLVRMVAVVFAGAIVTLRLQRDGRACGRRTVSAKTFAIDFRGLLVCCDSPIGDILLSNPSLDPARAAQLELSLERACVCAKVADDFRGQDTLVLDLTHITPIVDYFVITSATNRRQMHAIADEAGRALKSAGSVPLSTEGYDNSSWILEDYGDIVLHIFSPEARSIYDLEHLWADARRIDWRTATAARRA